ncbi:hypothetical protein [Paeniglutamicibacter terrestris]|uniref:Uncharacterized protein n=1 Tax=Paeniglutamicibacter terrestris TaxID=2723403 RepID=A0ABX1G6C6_9MICC|nr:hypothetical protein [Paeniglutamicibacter terrestris]NKG21080.1 hypothetical protein [Paeniglutamicibacter terrestris]
MNETPIYDQLRWEYSSREFMARLNESYRRVREVFNAMSRDLADAFKSSIMPSAFVMRAANDAIGADDTPHHFVSHPRRNGKLSAYYAVIDEVAEYDHAAWELARNAHMDVASAQAIIDQAKKAWAQFDHKSFAHLQAVFQIPPKPPVWVNPPLSRQQLNHQRPQTRALGRTQYHQGRR